MSRPSDPPDLRLLKNDKAHAHRHVDKDKGNDCYLDLDKVLPPEEMGSRAKEVFSDTLYKLTEQYQLNIFDIDVLVIYSNNQEQLEAMETLLRCEGVVYDTPHGIKERPEVKIHKDCKTIALKMLQDFKKLPKKQKAVNSNPFAKFGSM